MKPYFFTSLLIDAAGFKGYAESQEKNESSYNRAYEVCCVVYKQVGKKETYI